MENPTLPRVYVLPRADALLPAKGGSEHTRTITPPPLHLHIIFLGGVATYFMLHPLQVVGAGGVWAGEGSESPCTGGAGAGL